MTTDLVYVIQSLTWSAFGLVLGYVAGRVARLIWMGGR